MVHTTARYTHDAATIADLSLLVRIGRLIRLGPRLTYTPQLSLDTETADDVKLGSEFGLNVVGEPAIPVATRAWVAPRGELGAVLLFPSGGTRRALQGMQDLCNAQPNEDHEVCTRLDPPVIGLAGGIGAGAILEVGDQVRLRADLLVRYYWLEMANLNNGPYGDAMHWTMSGLRAAVFFGADLL